MAGELGKLNKDPLFLALTRPTMIFGVTYSWFGLNVLVWVMYFINAKGFGVMSLGMAITHVVGFMACSYEPRFMDLIKAWAMTVPKCLNKYYHGNTCSYDFY